MGRSAEEGGLLTLSPDEPEHKPVDFEDCIKTWTAKMEVELTCSNCGHPRATMKNGFLTLPDVIVVTASRFILKNLGPHKTWYPQQHPKHPSEHLQGESMWC